MRLLLDANLSPRGVAARLRETGHDVVALAQDRALEGLADPQVLELAASEGRVLITRNSRDFAPLARQWAEAQRSHAGLILIWTLDHSQCAEIVAGLEQQLQRWPSQEQWLDDRDLLRGRPRVLWASHAHGLARAALRTSAGSARPSASRSMLTGWRAGQQATLSLLSAASSAWRSRGSVMIGEMPARDRELVRMRQSGARITEIVLRVSLAS